MFLALEPLVNLRRLVILCVVGDQVDLGAAIVAKELVQELDERLCVEDLYEPGVPLRVGTDSDCAHDLDALANRWTEHVASDADKCPCPDEGSGLLKHCFILVKRYG